MTLGQNLQAARKAKGLSQETLAEQIGVSRQALGKWEKDTALPGLDNLQAAAQVLGVPVDTLLGTEAVGPAPAVTLDAMRDLLAARDAEQRKHRRLWGLLGAADQDETKAGSKALPLFARIHKKPLFLWYCRMGLQ